MPGPNVKVSVHSAGAPETNVHATARIENAVIPFIWRSMCIGVPCDELGHVDWWHRCGRARHEISLVLASCGQHERKSYKENDKPSHREPPKSRHSHHDGKGSLAVSRTA
jgi:hypothetical protein